MPIYLDRHFVEGATRNTLALAHEKDLEVQDQYQVKFLTYWFDEARSTAFCLVDAPNKEAVQRTHDEAHGGIPSEILEVDPSIVEAFLGRVKDPTPVDINSEPVIDSAFRGIMFTDLKDSTLMTTLYGDAKALHLLHIHNAITRNAIRDFNGTEVKHTGDGFMVSFSSIIDMVNCALNIQKNFNLHNQTCPEDALEVRIGLSAGEPIEEHGDLFGSAVQKAARLCALAQPGQVFLSEEVHDQCEAEKLNFEDMGPIELKGFHHATELYQVRAAS